MGELLSQDKIRELILKYQKDGDESALVELIDKNLGLVRHVANKYKRVYDYLWSRLKDYSSVVVPQQNKASDIRADPALCNGTWWSWMDGKQGCWFKVHKYDTMY